MTSSAGEGLYTIYPKRYFDASPTWFAWNKLSAADVHSLREEKGFEGQDVYFWLNHPIQYVRLVGMVSGFESIADGKWFLFTLDDCSGANIEIKVKARQTRPNDTAQYPSTTEVDNLDVATSLGTPRVLIDRRLIDPGDVVRAQGTVTKFRNTYQLLLKRIWRINDTNEEAVLWSKTADWKRTVLARPWVLTDDERSKIDQETRCRAEAERQKSEQRARRAAHVSRKHHRHLEKHETKRLLQEKEMNSGALEGSDILHTPWH